MNQSILTKKKGVLVLRQFFFFFLLFHSLNSLTVSSITCFSVFVRSFFFNFIQASAPGGQGATPAPSLGSDCLTSDPDTKFELKGLTLPSPPPLGSDSGFSDVYTSDKLNFL